MPATTEYLIIRTRASGEVEYLNGGKFVRSPDGARIFTDLEAAEDLANLLNVNPNLTYSVIMKGGDDG